MASEIAVPFQNRIMEQHHLAPLILDAQVIVDAVKTACKGFLFQIDLHIAVLTVSADEFHNHLNTPNGAKASADVYSIVETAKANGLDSSEIT